MKEKILILGSGAREHALGVACQQNNDGEVWIYPGNAGTAHLGFLPPIPPEALPAHLPRDHETLARFTDWLSEHNVGLVVIGPEGYMAQGLYDALQMSGIATVGCSMQSSHLESSKSFAKDFFNRYHIRTAATEICDTYSEAQAALDRRKSYPIVLKYDGLALGKGVLIAQDRAAANAFCQQVFTGVFGESKRCLLETYLAGREVSVIGMCDGKTFRWLPTSQDFKRRYAQDQGPNTGGMGAISPCPWLESNPTLLDTIQTRIVTPFLTGLAKEGWEYRGFLYLGLMVVGHEVYVLETNVRLGDPETQAILPRIRQHFVANLRALAEGNLDKAPPLEVSADSTVYIVAAAKQYPTASSVGKVILGHLSPQPPDFLRWAGVDRSKDGQWTTNGGRIFGVGSQGETQAMARERAYAALAQVQCDDIEYRPDIGDDS